MSITTNRSKLTFMVATVLTVIYASSLFITTFSSTMAENMTAADTMMAENMTAADTMIK